LTGIDREGLMAQLAATNISLLAISFPLIYVIYFLKAKRFAEFTNTTEVSIALNKHWRICNIGLFLASITPGKLGEFGRAAYLKAAGIPMPTAIAIAIIDRLFDVACILIIAIASVGILFGSKSAFVVLMLVCAAAVMGLKLIDISKRFPWLHFFHELIAKKKVIPASFWTVLAWVVHFTWTILIARAVGIDLDIHILVSVMTMVGIIGLLPIAPAGLGTRDATLIFLLAPFGIEAERAVALAFLMFVSIILSGLLGGYYFLRGTK
jgi:uncharacterized membrane protein YbhN (UPF0104 family)